jgi:hypothetical protein
MPSPPIALVAKKDSRALILSMRSVADVVGYCALYEFEDIIADLTASDLGKVEDFDGIELSRKVYRAARILSGSPRLVEFARPKRSLRLSKTYDLFLPVFNHPHELYALSAIRDWRDRCRIAACYLCEAWDTRLPVYLIELLKNFDHVFVGVHGSVDAVAKICGRPCTYLPMGVDALAFCPYPNPPFRSIDVCGIGRRSPVTHQALLDFAQKQSLFYYYDTTQTTSGRGAAKAVSFRVTNHREHRMLFANLLKRSRYFIANRAWADQPNVTRGRGEIAARFYEGAASGAIMLGDPPDGDDFRRQFGWTDSVVRTPFHAPQIADVITELDADPARSAGIRRDSIVNALHLLDWAYRLRTVLETVGLPPTDRLLAREATLRALATDVLRSSS